MSDQYKNYRHYIKEGWAKTPKDLFKFVNKFIKEEAEQKEPRLKEPRLLDVGCATGELIHYLSSQHSDFDFTGVEIFDDLIDQCRELQPERRFEKVSVLDFPKHFSKQFDLITVVGVMSIFDEAQLPLFFDNLFRACRKGGTIFIVSPLNEFGVDCEIRHRKRHNQIPGEWEKGWNIFSQETISDLIRDTCHTFSFHPFQISFDLAQRKDPVRTWTMRTDKNERQLTNGLNLLINHYLIKINL